MGVTGARWGFQAHYGFRLVTGAQLGLTGLQAWPRIHEHLPDASLHVYYGWTPGMLRFIQNQVPLNPLNQPAYKSTTPVFSIPVDPNALKHPHGEAPCTPAHMGRPLALKRRPLAL